METCETESVHQTEFCRKLVFALVRWNSESKKMSAHFGIRISRHPCTRTDPPIVLRTVCTPSAKRTQRTYNLYDCYLLLTVNVPQICATGLFPFRLLMRIISRPISVRCVLYGQPAAMLFQKYAHQGGNFSPLEPLPLLALEVSKPAISRRTLTTIACVGNWPQFP